MGTSSFKLSIPKPCYNSWEQMIPNDKGRHCISCNKTVFDFTLLSDEEIKSYFTHYKHEQICGRFQIKQLESIIIELPKNFFKKRIPYWQKILIILIICFCQSVISIKIGGFKSSSLYAQSSQKKYHPSKNSTKKKKLRIKRRLQLIQPTSLELPDISTMVLTGYTQTVELPPPMLKTICNPSDLDLDSGHYEIFTSPITQTKKEKKRSPSKEKSPTHIEAILPIVDSKRKRKISIPKI